MATMKRRGNSYLIRCYDGYDHKGKKVERTMTWKIPEGMSDAKAEKEALRQAILFEEDIRNGNVPEAKIKFADFAEKWMSDYAQVHLRPGTVIDYQALLVRINKAIGHIYLDRLRPTHLTAFYRDLGEIQKKSSYAASVDLKALLKAKGYTQAALARKAQISTGTVESAVRGNSVAEKSALSIAKALNVNVKTIFKAQNEAKRISGQTILHYHRLISSMLNTAVQWQYIPSNPAERVKAPKSSTKRAAYLDDEQAIELLTLLDDQPIHYKTAVIVLLFTGMRRGELLGLQWDDIDLEREIIKIQRARLYLPKQGSVLDETKTEGSNRVIRVPTTAVEQLLSYRKWLKGELLKIGQPLQENSPVFRTQNFTPMHPDSLTNWFAKFIKTTPLPQIHIHSLRHTNATLQIANGVSVTTVAGNLGHSNANTTTKVYAHSIQSAAAASAELMDTLLSPVRKNA